MEVLDGVRGTCSIQVLLRNDYLRKAANADLAKIGELLWNHSIYVDPLLAIRRGGGGSEDYPVGSQLQLDFAVKYSPTVRRFLRLHFPRLHLHVGKAALESRLRRREEPDVRDRLARRVLDGVERELG